MPQVAKEERLRALEERIETLELMVDKKLRKKIEKGLEDEKEGRTLSLKEYEEEEAS